MCAKIKNLARFRATLPTDPSGTKPIVDVADCPMFRDLYGGDGTVVTGTVAACLTILALVLLLNAVYFSVVRFRLVPKIRARFVDNTPYEDIVITEQGSRTNAAAATVSSRDARQQCENSSATLAAMSEDIGNRHVVHQQIRADLMVNTFGPPDQEFRSA